MSNSEFTLIDTHTHLDFEPFRENFDEILLDAQKNGVKKFIVPGVTFEDLDKVIELADKYENIYAAVAIHPSEAKTWKDDSYQILKTYANHPKVVAIGETGLDYYWDKSFIDTQQQVFIEHIKLAKELNKPVIVHDRDAHEDTLRILKENNAKDVGVVMHCFSGSAEFALECTKEGFYIALGGPVTFKNAKKAKEVAKAIPIEKLLLETDSPFLTPHPYRGQTNYPAMVKLVAEEIASLRGISVEELASITTENAKRLFNI
mgnify:CR=1 FL=1